MVRTAENAVRVAGGKSTRKGSNVNASSRSRSPSSDSGDGGTGGLNPICPRETPAWQKPITNFFTALDKSHRQSKAEQQPSFSTMVAEDINMMEDHNGIDQHISQISEASKYPCVETMDEEFQEIRIDRHESNKENSSPNETNVYNTVDNEDICDAEMGEVSKNTKKFNVREDSDEEMVPAKRFKLDNNMCEDLLKCEQL